MSLVKDVGEPCAGEPYQRSDPEDARFDGRELETGLSLPWPPEMGARGKPRG